jgi:RHS repeat-associated protein
MHFTGKQLDSETNNSYFGARYYATSANLARFMTPDWSGDASPVPYAKLDNPQTLNLYVYLRNNPLNTVDPDGHGQTGTPTSNCTNNGNGTACSKLGGIKKAWLDTIEVSGSIGLGAGVTGQVGTAQVTAQVGARVESTTGLGGGNSHTEGFGGAEVKAKLSDNAELGGKIGVTASKDGVTPSAEVNVKAGPVEGGVKADSSGVHPSGLSTTTTTDSKLGVHGQGLVGVGVAINFSQAGRALDATESAIGQFWNDFMTGKITP